MSHMTSSHFVDKVFAIGDIHGDLDALLRILLGLNLVDDQGNWRGASAKLVMMGDLVDRGPDSFSVMNHVMMLESQAAQAGGELISLLGNHEMFVSNGSFQFFRAREILELENFWIDDRHGLDAIFRGDSVWAAWLRRRPVWVKLGETIFVHAGIEKWALEWDFDELNQALQAWIAHFQGVASEPPEETFWLTEDGGGGPIWSRAFVARSGGSPADIELQAVIEQFLAQHQAKRLVVGHCPTKNVGYQIAWPHPQLGEKVALIDTGISMAIGGQLSALVIDDGRFEPCYFERGTEPLPLTAVLRCQYLSQLKACP